MLMQGSIASPKAIPCHQCQWYLQAKPEIESFFGGMGTKNKPEIQCPVILINVHAIGQQTKRTIIKNVKHHTAVIALYSTRKRSICKFNSQTSSTCTPEPTRRLLCPTLGNQRFMDSSTNSGINALVIFHISTSLRSARDRALP